MIHIPNSIIEASDISITLSGQKIIDNINMSIVQGEITALIGPSGSGKSTIIKALTGMVRPEGNLYVLGFKMPSIDPLQNIGFMAQSDALYEDLSAKENLKFFGKLYGLKGKILNSNIDRVLELTHLSDDKNKKVRFYSGGMKRRLSMAIALIHDPVLLILDEPTVGLDPTLRVEFKQLFKQYCDEGKTIIMTTHVMGEAMDCNHIYMLREGKIIANGSPQDLVNEFGSLDEAFISYCKRSEKS